MLAVILAVMCVVGCRAENSTEHASATPLTSATSYIPQHGDILFQSLPFSPIILTIEGSTQSPYSHCGMLAHENGEWLVYEAIGPVRKTPFPDWVNQGRQSRFDAYRLQPTFQHHIPHIITAMQPYLGMPYDIEYEFGDEEIYCSELIYLAYQEVTGESLVPLLR